MAIFPSFSHSQEAAIEPKIHAFNTDFDEHKVSAE